MKRIRRQSGDTGNTLAMQALSGVSFFHPAATQYLNLSSGYGLQHGEHNSPLTGSLLRILSPAIHNAFRSAAVAASLEQVRGREWRTFGFGLSRQDGDASAITDPKGWDKILVKDLRHFKDLENVAKDFIGDK